MTLDAQALPVRGIKRRAAETDREDVVGDGRGTEIEQMASLGISTEPITRQHGRAPGEHGGGLVAAGGGRTSGLVIRALVLGAVAGPDEQGAPGPSARLGGAG